MRLLRHILLVAPFALLPSCGPSEASVKAEIAAANHCEVDADCDSAGTKCPFGCTIPVNKSEVAHIKQVLDDFGEERCAYDCAPVSGITCQNKVCVAQIAQ